MTYFNIRYFIIIILLLGYAPMHAAAEDIEDYDTSTVSDPIEGFNRNIYGFNRAIDAILLKPIAKGYRYIVPELGRRGVGNFLTNLSEPLTFINSVLQGDVEHGFTTFWRFTLNSTFGIGGIFDVAKDAGLENRKEDFGQTAGVYGSGQGMYIMLPVLGPSNTRDTLGRVVDIFTDPFNYIFEDEALIIRAGMTGIDARESSLDLTDHIEKTSLDPYATIRSLYTQKRQSEIRNGKRNGHDIPE